MDTITREEIISDIQMFYIELSKPFSEEDLKGGWSEKSRQSCIKLFKQMESDLRDKNINLKNKIEYITLVRGLDYWGITKGKLFEQALTISSKINDVAKKENLWCFWRRWFQK